MSRPAIISFSHAKSIGGGRTFIIAEVGSNHMRDLDLACAHIKAAAEAGADAVKFQSLNLDALYHQPAEQLRALHSKIDLPEEWHGLLKECCDEHGLIFLSSATYPRSVEIMEAAAVEVYKLASAQIGVYPQLVKQVAETGKPVILSTGLVIEDQMERVVQIFRDAGNDQFVILHCNSLYPAPAAVVHMPRMTDYQHRFDCRVGFSDHTETHTASIVAVALGAVVIERHFTLSRELDSPDAPLSLAPPEFTSFVQAIREAETICQPSSRSRLEKNEAAFKARIHHYLLSTQPIKAGEPITDANSRLMRGGPVKGVNAWDVYNRPAALAVVDIAAGVWITPDQIQLGSSDS
jgi:sialic acid synthase SpsE